MKLHEALDAPRILRIGGTPYAVGRLTLLGKAILDVFIEEECPGEEWGSDAAYRILLGPEGLPRLVYCALYKHNPGVDWGMAYAIANGLDEPTMNRLVALLFARSDEGREEKRKNGHTPNRPPIIRSEGKMVDDLLDRRGIDYATASHLSIDQLVNLQWHGEPPGSHGAGLSHAEARARAEEARAQAIRDGTYRERPTGGDARVSASDDPVVLAGIEELKAHRSGLNGEAG